MKKDIKQVELTRELYLQETTNISSKMVCLKQNKDDKVLEIEGRIEALKDLKKGLKAIKKNIRVERRFLRRNKAEKFSISRTLSKINRYAKKLNKSFSRGDETIVCSDFYSVEHKKTR